MPGYLATADEFIKPFSTSARNSPNGPDCPFTIREWVLPRTLKASRRAQDTHSNKIARQLPRLRGGQGGVSPVIAGNGLQIATVVKRSQDGPEYRTLRPGGRGCGERAMVGADVRLARYVRARRCPSFDQFCLLPTVCQFRVPVRPLVRQPRHQVRQQFSAFSLRIRRHCYR